MKKLGILALAAALSMGAVTVADAGRYGGGFSSSSSFSSRSYSSSSYSRPSYSSSSYSRPSYSAPSVSYGRSSYTPAPSYNVRSTTLSSSYKPAASAPTSTYRSTATAPVINRTTIVHQSSPVIVHHYGYGGGSGMGFWHGYFLASMFNHQPYYGYGGGGYMAPGMAGGPVGYAGWGPGDMILGVLALLFIIAVAVWIVVALRREVD